MSELLNTQEVLSASTNQSVGVASGTINPKTSNTSGTTSASFSKVFSESVENNEANASSPDTVTNIEPQQYTVAATGKYGKPANQVANGWDNNGNSLPTGIAEDPIQDLLSEFHPAPLAGFSASIPTAPIRPVGASSTSNPELSMLKDTEVSSNNLLKSINEPLASNAKVTSIGLHNAGASQTSVYNSNSSDLRLVTQVNNESSDLGLTTQVNSDNAGVTGYKSSQLSSPKDGDATIASTVVLSENHEATEQIRSIKPVEQLLDGLKPLPSESMKVPPNKGNIKDRTLNPNARPNLMQGIEEYTGLKPAFLKTITQETVKEVSQPTWNQVLRPSSIQNLESPSAINKDFSRIINSQFAIPSGDLAMASIEEIDSNSMRAQLAMPKSGIGLSGILVSGTPVTSTLTSTINSPAWSQEFNQQLVIFAQKDIKQANIQLNPQHLGPMEVRISMGSEQQVNVSFSTQHGMVKEAIDSALPRLREMFEQQGLNLGDVNVSQNAEQNTRRQQFHNNNFTSHDTDQGGNGAVEEEQTLLLTNSQSNNLVDYYA